MKQRQTNKALVKRLQDFLRQHKELTITGLGAQALGDTAAVRRIINGEADIRLSTHDRLVDWMEAYERPTSSRRRLAA